MTVRLIGPGRLVALMRLERASELDMSWLLYGPAMDDALEAASDPPPAWRYAAE